MEGKPCEASKEALRAALLRLAVAHNRAVLAGMTIAVTAAIALVGLGVAGPQLAGGGSLRLVALPLLAASIVIGWRGLRLHRRVVRDLGAGRAAAVEVTAALLARGGEATHDALVAAVGPANLERGVNFLARLELISAERGPLGIRLRLDAARLAPLLDPPVGPR